jgi:hypothetical protein
LWNRYAFAEGHLQRDSRERAGAHPYRIAKRGWMGCAARPRDMTGCTASFNEPVSTRDSASEPELVGTPLPRVPDIRCGTGERMRLRRDNYRGIPGSARERIPTGLQSAVGCGCAARPRDMTGCTASFNDPFSTRDSASGPELVGTPLLRVPDIRCGTGTHLRRDNYRGIPGNARERIPTRLESAVGWAALQDRAIGQGARRRSMTQSARATARPNLSW